MPAPGLRANGYAVAGSGSSSGERADALASLLEERTDLPRSGRRPDVPAGAAGHVPTSTRPRAAAIRSSQRFAPMPSHSASASSNSSAASSERPKDESARA